MGFFVDVHTHLTHDAFAADLDEVVSRAKSAGVQSIVVNGLEPKSNRMILEMAEKFSMIRPALGIYPLDAVCDQIPHDFPFEVPVFDVNAEIDFIRQQAKLGKITAIGECGLDGYYLGQDYLAGQEAVFERLIDIAVDFNLPLIIHTRKCEKRAGEILASCGVKKVNFHCFTGRASMAKDYAERQGWYFSIPANCHVNEGFQKMMRTLPPELLLTETDAPYLPPMKGQRNEPANVVSTVKLLAELRSWSFEKARDQVFQNYLRLFGQLSE